MQFIVIGRDGTDENALERRMAAREAHLETAKEMYESGKWLYENITGLDGVVSLTALDCKLSLAKIYERVNWDEEMNI